MSKVLARLDLARLDLMSVVVLTMMAAVFIALSQGEAGWAVLLAGLPAWFAISYRLPFLAPMLFVSMSTFRVHEAIPVLAPLSIPYLLSIFGLVSFAMWLFLTREHGLRFPRQLQAFLALSALVTIGVQFAAQPTNASDIWSETYVKVMLMTTVCCLIARKPSDLSLVAVSFIACGMLLSGLLMMNKIFQIGLVEGSRAVAVPGSNSLLGDPNDTALIIMCPLALAAAYAGLPGSPATRVLGGLSALVIMGGLISTQSRGGMLGFVAVLAYLLSQIVKSRATSLAILGSTVVVLALAMGLLVRVSGGEVAHGGLDESSGNRLVAWRAAWDMALANPLTGVGLGGFTPSFYAYTRTWVDHAMAVHSSWFQVLGECGFPGLAMFITMIVLIGMSLHASHRLLQANNARPSLIALSHGVTGAYYGWIVTASFITHAFTWPIYGILAMSVMLDTCAQSDTSHTAGRVDTPDPQRLLAQRERPSYAVPQ